MTIDRLGSAGPIQNLDASAKNLARVAEPRSDSLSISEEGLKKAEFFRTAEIVHAEADVRADRVAAVKAKLSDPSYLSSIVLQKTADRILEQFLGS
jgi:hypothetical protein